MGITNSCTKSNCSCFGWKKTKNFRRRKGDLSESIVKFRDDGSVGVEGLPTARIPPNRNYLWNHVFTRSEGRGNLGNFQPSETKSLEIVSVPSEDRFVRMHVDRQLEGNHFNISLRSSLPPPIPPRKIERSLPVVNEEKSSDMTLNLAEKSEDMRNIHRNEPGVYKEAQLIPSNICLYSEGIANWKSSKTQFKTNEGIRDSKVIIPKGIVKNDSEFTLPPPIPPRMHI